MIDSVVAATVTYGDRWKYLKEVIKRLDELSNIRLIIIIANGINYRIEDKILEELTIDTRIQVKYLEDNLGSAGGFKSAIEECAANKVKGDFFLLLDDDNLPNKNIFDNLENDTKSSNLDVSKYVISFFRARYATELFHSGITWNKEKYFNTYCKFSFLNKVWPKRKVSISNPADNFVETIYSQYSGLLFSEEVVNKIGYPNENYYLYVDDTDYTYKMGLSGYKILAYRNGVITDMENSWSQENSIKETNPHKMIFQGDNDRGLYYIRNRVYFETQYLVTNKFLYNINIIIYYLGIFILYMPKSIEGFKTFKKMIVAVSHGKKGILGKF